MFFEESAVDEKDKKLIALCMHNPEVSQTELARMLKISQPSVNARIRKLKKKGLLTPSLGIDLSKTKMYIARVDFTAPHADKILSSLKECSFFANGFIMSGKHNISVLVVGPSLKKIEAIVNKHLRTDPSISDISMSVVVSTAKPFICTLALDKHTSCQDPGCCESCPINKKDSL